MRKERDVISCAYCGKKYKLAKSLSKHVAEAHKFNDKAKQEIHNQGSKMITPTSTEFVSKIKSEPENEEQQHPQDMEDKEKSGIEFINIQENTSIEQKIKEDFPTRSARTTEKGDKEYICAICKKIYPRPSRLRRHFRKHTGERRIKWFNCLVCQKQFSTEDKLQKHNLRRHTQRGVQTSAENADIGHDASNSCHTQHERDSDDVDIKLEPDEADDAGEVDEFADCDNPSQDTLQQNKSTEVQGEKSKPSLLQRRGSRFKCTFCRLSYSHQKFLDRHLLYHTQQEKPFPCKSCDKQFDKASQLRFHREKVHAQEKCDVCGEMVVSLHDRQRHKTMHAEKQYKYECGICRKRLCRLKSLQYHIESMHMGEKKFKCEICLKGYPRVGLLMAHSIEKHGNDKPFSCKKCGFKVNRLASLRSHMITHTKEKNFHCETCGKSFGHSSTFYKHLRMHERAKMPPQQKEKPDETARATQERHFQCEICAKAFIRLADLKLHLRFHSDVRPYKCTVCPKAFHSSSIMKNHIDRHFGIRKHICKHCGLSYTDPTGLRRHLVKHGDTRIKTFKCNECGKVFVQKYQLTRHANTHTPGATRRRVHPQVNSKEFPCGLCQRTYINKSGIKKHLKKHGDSNMKPIECPHCSKWYLNAEALGRHYEVHGNPVVTEVSLVAHQDTLQQNIVLQPTQLIILPDHTKEMQVVFSEVL